MDILCTHETDWTFTHYEGPWATLTSPRRHNGAIFALNSLVLDLVFSYQEWCTSLRVNINVDFALLPLVVQIRLYLCLRPGQRYLYTVAGYYERFAVNIQLPMNPVDDCRTRQ